MGTSTRSVLRSQWGSIRRALIVALVLVNAAYLGGCIYSFAHLPLWPDWAIFHRAAQSVLAGADPYAAGPYHFRWSPIAAWLLVPLTAAGPLLWQAGLVASTFLLRDRRTQLLILVSWPFWYDVFVGNLMTLVVVTAILAVRGSRAATWAFLALARLVPRPLMLPVVAWLLWRRPELRLGFGLLLAANVALVLASGWAPQFLARLAITGGDMGLAQVNLAPSRLIGAAWIPIGATLAAWFTWRGRLGWAALAVSPYLLPNYLMMGLLELSPTRSSAQEAFWPRQRT
jgi:hypothetical protein